MIANLNLSSGVDEQRGQYEIPLIYPPPAAFVNLDGCWRAAGRPIGRHPRLWIDLAAPLIAGLSSYLAGLYEVSPRFATDARLVEEVESSARDAGALGDLIAHRLLANAYATS